MRLRHALKAAALRVPAFRDLIDERDRLRLERGQLVRERANPRPEHPFVPPGHFYSPIPSLSEVGRDAARIFAPPPRTLPGIDLREAAQLALLERFIPFYAEMPFAPEKTPGLRYHFENGAYSYADAIMLCCMLRHLQPKRVIEIGSGYSSAVTLDSNERFLQNRIEATFIEPYPDLLHSLLKPGDAERIEIISKRLQDVPVALFSRTSRQTTSCSSILPMSARSAAT